MLISLCVPIMNRLDDLKETMPDRIANANSSPPVNIAILDYNSTDGLDTWVKDNLFGGKTSLARGSSLSYTKYDKRDYFHSTHAYNLALLMGAGEWVILTPADVFVRDGYVNALRERIAEGCKWCNTDRKRRSTIAFNKAEFVAIGGYDERFETYGPDDIDIIERLERRGLKRGSIPDHFLKDIFTPADKKVANYRIKGSHRDLGKAMMLYLYENRANNVIVANQGMEWGRFDV